MLYFKLDTANDKVVEIRDRAPSLEERHEPEGNWYCRVDFDSYEDAERIAKEVSAFSGKLYLATDAGAYCSPRYDVVRAYEVGEPVSYGFNGDSYPAGEIVSISASRRVITVSSGLKFYRVGKSGTWRSGGTWFLGRGHVYKQNPSF